MCHSPLVALHITLLIIMVRTYRKMTVAITTAPILFFPCSTSIQPRVVRTTHMIDEIQDHLLRLLHGIVRSRDGHAPTIGIDILFRFASMIHLNPRLAPALQIPNHIPVLADDPSDDPLGHADLFHGRSSQWQCSAGGIIASITTAATTAAAGTIAIGTLAQHVHESFGQIDVLLTSPAIRNDFGSPAIDIRLMDVDVTRRAGLDVADGFTSLADDAADVAGGEGALFFEDVPVVVVGMGAMCW